VFGLALVLALAGVACAGAATRPAPLLQLERAVQSPLTREVQRDAPEAYAEYARAVAAAHAASRGDEDDLADRVAEADLTLAWAATQARANAARRRVAEAERRTHEAEVDAGRMEQQTTAIQREVSERVQARDALARTRAAAAAPASVPQPERAAAAADLRQQAELLIASAALLGATEQARAPALALLRSAEDAGGRPDATASLVAAGRAYQAAEALIRSTRAATPAPATSSDGAQLVNDLAGNGGLDPRRDARGVIAVMRGLFGRGAELLPTSRGRLEAMARIVQGHPDARIRVEAFVGGADRARATHGAEAQAQAVVAGLTRAGVPAARLQAAGLFRVPGGTRGDDRVEIVLVLPQEP
jgi:hypothetical protein